MAQYKNIAVLTGDIVGSQNLEPGALDAGFAALVQAADWLRRTQKSEVWFDRFRGDGWQMAVSNATTAPLALALIWSGLHSLKIRTRVALALGDAQVPNSDLSASSGPSFLASGHGLEGMDRGKTLWVAPDCPLAWRSTFPLMEEIAKGWTARQAQTCDAALKSGESLNISALADKAGVKKQSIHTHLDRSGFEAFATALEALTDASTKYD